MSAHTPGPWFQGKRYLYTTEGGKEMYGCDLKKIFSHEQNTTRGRWSDGLLALADTEADARLIAAAPDMLAVLQSFLAPDVSFFHGDITFGEITDGKALEAAIRAAIDKATGTEEIGSGLK